MSKNPSATATTKSKIRPQKVILEPFEDSVHYQTMVTFRLRGMEVGAYLLKKTPKSPFTLVFGFECPGIHSFLSKEKFGEFFETFEMGLKDLPQGERITFHLGAYKNDRDRQEHLAKLIEGAPSDEVRFLLMGERARVRQLCDEGLREPKSLNIFVTYRARVGGHHQHWLDTALAKLDELWQQYTGQSQRIQEGQIKRLLRRAWGRGFIYWKQILENKLKLRVFPMGPQSMWKYLWERLNPLEMQPIDLPQQVVVSGRHLSEESHSPVHGASLLIGDREPTYNREWVRVGGKYVGILTFWDKPGGWKDKQSQLRYLWDLVAQRLV
ncbi:MAG: hypothetical protein ACRDEA_04975, partial [Microcystaceae cyanobacterium]